MNKFWAIINALYEGRSLENVETWKNVQQVTIAITAIAGVIPTIFPDVRIGDEQIQAISTCAVAVGGVVSAYLTPATTTKIGFKKKE